MPDAKKASKNLGADRLATLSRRVTGLVQAMGHVVPPTTPRRSQAARYFLEMSRMPSGSTVTINGPRGAGKTTVLLHAMERLAQQRDMVVLPVIRPEFFSGTDSLLGTALESLNDWMRANVSSTYRANISPRSTAVGDTEPQPAHLWLERLLRWEAASRPFPELRGDDIDQKTFGLLAATRRASELTALWRPTMTALLRAIAANRGVEAMRLVVPVDDADLAPQHLPSILTDLRFIDEHEMCTCVVCLTEDDLVHQLRVSAIRESGVEAQYSAPSRAIVAARIEKALPLQNWVNLSPWTPAERLAFQCTRERRQASPPVTLRALLEAIKLPNAVAGFNVGNLFVIEGPGGTSDPSFYALALPNRPRGLERLYLQFQLEESDGGGPCAGRLSRLIRVILSDALVGTPITPEKLFMESDFNGVRAAEMDLTNVEFFGQPARSAVIRLPYEQSDVTLLRIRNTGARVRITEADETTKLHEDLPQSAVAALLFLLDIDASTEYFADFRVSGARPWAGGSNWTQPALRLMGERTDNAFMRVPAWEGYYDYFVLYAYLDRVMDAIEHENLAVPRPDLVEWFALSQLICIVSIQNERKQPDLAKSTRRFVEPVAPSLNRTGAPVPASGWPAAREALLPPLGRALRRTYGACVENPGQRNNDFRDWFERSFLNLVHPMLISGETAEFLVTTFRSAVRKAGRQEVALAHFRGALDRRVTGAGEQPWARHLVRFGRELGLPGYEERHHEIEQGARSERVGRLASALVDEESAAEVRQEPSPADHRSIVAAANEYLAQSEPPGSAIEQSQMIVELTRRILDRFVNRGELHP